MNFFLTAHSPNITRAVLLESQPTKNIYGYIGIFLGVSDLSVSQEDTRTIAGCPFHFHM